MNFRAQTERSVDQIAKTEWAEMHKENGGRCTKKLCTNAQRNCAQMQKEAVHKHTKRLNQQWSVAAEVGNPAAVLAQPAPERRNNLSHLFLSILYNSLLFDWRNIVYFLRPQEHLNGWPCLNFIPKSVKNMIYVFNSYDRWWSAAHG